MASAVDASRSSASCCDARDADPRLAVPVDRDHVERAERAEKRALVRGRLHREQLVDERPDPGAGRPGDDRLGQDLERLRLMVVEEHRRDRGDRGSLLRLFDRRGIRQVLVDRVLRLDRDRQRERTGGAAKSTCSAARRGMPSLAVSVTTRRGIGLERSRSTLMAGSLAFCHPDPAHLIRTAQIGLGLYPSSTVNPKYS